MAKHIFPSLISPRGRKRGSVKVVGRLGSDVLRREKDSALGKGETREDGEAGNENLKVEDVEAELAS